MTSEDRSHKEGSVRFSRILRLPWIVALGASVSVGLGVYTLLGEYVLVVGGYSAAASYLVLMAIALPIILTYAERAGVIPGSGGAYNLSRAGGRLGATYATGWLLIAGYASLAALLGWGMALHLNLLLEQFFNLSIPLPWLAAVLIGLVAANSISTTTQDWKARVTFIYLAILMLVLLAIRDFVAAETPGQSSIYIGNARAVSGLATLMVCGLWGFEFVLSMRDEIRRPTRTVLPAMLLIVLLGAGLGALAALAVARYPAGASDSLTPLIDLGSDKGWLPEGLVVLVYALFGLGLNLLALGWAITGSLRLLDALRRDGFVPEKLEKIPARRGKPFLFLLLIAGFSIVLVLVLPVLTLSGLAAITFLWTVALVHIPDLLRAKPGLPLNRRPKLPFHPLFPGLTVATGILVPFYLPWEVWALGLVWGLLGALYYLFYARQRGVAIRRRDIVVGETSEEMLAAEAEYRVMVGISDPDTALDLIRAGARLASARDGSLLVLRNVILPEQMPAHLKRATAREEWESLADLVQEAGVEDVSVHSLVRMASSLREGLLEAVREEQIDLLLLTWAGEYSPDDVTPDPIINAVVEYAPCDVAVLRGLLPPSPQRIMVPTAGGPHAPSGLALGRDLSDREEGRISLVHIVVGELTPEQETAADANLQTTLDAIPDSSDVKARVLQARSAHEGILAEAKNADLLLIGASKEEVIDRSYFGGLSAQVADASPIPTILARGREIGRTRWLLRVWGFLTDPLPKLTVDRRAQVAQSLRDAAVPSVDFFVLIVLSAMIATLGLLQDSAAVIIGAMLVAPLMSPILAMAMSMVRGEWQVLRLAAEATAKGVTLAILVGVVVTLISPLDEATGEILARTEPNVLDLMVALASGAAAGYAISRKEVAAALPGVAIAAALVPPLCVVGYGIGVSELDMAAGALLLFVTNLIAIVLAASFTFLALGFHPQRTERGELMRGLKITALSLGIITLVLGVMTFATVQKLNAELAVEEAFRDGITAGAGRVGEWQLKRHRHGYTIAATVLNYEGRQLTPEEVQELELDLTAILGERVVLDVTTVDASRVTTGLAELDQLRLLEVTFVEEVEARQAEVAEVEAWPSGEGYMVEATVVTYEQGTGQPALTDEGLVTIQAALSDTVGAPVGLQVRILPGRYTELEAGATPAPPPLPTTNEVPMRQSTEDAAQESKPGPWVGHVIKMRRQER